MPVTLGFTVDTRLPTSILDVPKIKADITAIQNKFAQAAFTKATTYPTQRPLSKYKRSNRLRDGWAIEQSHQVGDTLEAIVTNQTTVDKRGRFYPRFVYGSESANQRQAAVHRNRWPTERQLINTADYIKEAEQAVFRGVKLG